VLFSGVMHLISAKEAVRIATESKKKLRSKLIDGYIDSMDKKDG
jgi:hypothetical protein